MEDYYNVFHRTWWRDNPAYPNGLEPHIGKRTYLSRHVIYTDAREVADEYNRTHTFGRLSRKAEIERVEP